MPIKSKGGLGREQAETIALTALAWLVADETQAERFVALTGCDGASLARRAGQPDFLGAVLDFLLGNEATLLDFAAQADLAPDAIARARALLPGAMV